MSEQVKFGDLKPGERFGDDDHDDHVTRADPASPAAPELVPAQDVISAIERYNRDAAALEVLRGSGSVTIRIAGGGGHLITSSVVNDRIPDIVRALLTEDLDRQRENLRRRGIDVPAVGDSEGGEA